MDWDQGTRRRSLRTRASPTRREPHTPRAAASAVACPVWTDAAEVTDRRTSTADGRLAFTVRRYKYMHVRTSKRVHGVAQTLASLSSSAAEVAVRRAAGGVAMSDRVRAREGDSRMGHHTGVCGPSTAISPECSCKAERHGRRSKIPRWRRAATVGVHALSARHIVDGEPRWRAETTRTAPRTRLVKGDGEVAPQETTTHSIQQRRRRADAQALPRAHLSTGGESSSPRARARR